MHKDIERIGELSKDGVFIYDLSASVFIYMNDACASLFNLPKDRMMTMPQLVLAMILSEDTYYLGHCFEELKQKRSTDRSEFRLQIADGSIRHMSCDAYFLETELIAGFVKDITLDRQHQDYIINYGAKKDTLLDMMTHNLAGPLALSQNLLRWMKEGAAANDVPSEFLVQLNMIQENTQECLDIVNDFLRQEHSESERIYVKKTRFDVLDRITQTLDKLIETNKTKRFRLITKLENLNISTDSVKFFQVIHNLVSNAIKFTPDQGEIDIVVEETPETFIVRVRDNGIGIPSGLQEVLFDKRTKAKRSGLQNQHSSGLGLSIVRNLVELLDGTVSFRTELNRGSEFSIELPKA